MSDIVLSRRGGLVELRLGRFLDPETFARCHPGTEAALRAVFDPAEGRVRT